MIPYIIEKYLSSEALSFFKLLRAKFQKLDYKTFKTSFLAQFKDEDRQNKLELQLRNLKLSDPTKLLDHVFKVKALCAKLSPTPSDSKVIFYIMSSLPHDIAQTFSLYPHNTMDEFDRSLKLFLARDSLLSLSTQSAPNPPSAPQILSVESQQNKKFKPKSKKFFEKNQENRPPPPPKSSNTCPICAGNHEKLNCSIIVCRYCKSVGHYIHDCPSETCRYSKYYKGPSKNSKKNF